MIPQIKGLNKPWSLSRMAYKVTGGGSRVKTSWENFNFDKGMGSKVGTEDLHIRSPTTSHRSTISPTTPPSRMDSFISIYLPD